MDSTSVSLLRRLRSDDREAAWERFVDLYAPLIYHWGKIQGLNPTDTADLVQEVLADPRADARSGTRDQDSLAFVARGCHDSSELNSTTYSERVATVVKGSTSRSMARSSVSEM